MPMDSAFLRCMWFDRKSRLSLTHACGNFCLAFLAGPVLCEFHGMTSHRVQNGRAYSLGMCWRVQVHIPMCVNLFSFAKGEPFVDICGLLLDHCWTLTYGTLGSFCHWAFNWNCLCQRCGLRDLPRIEPGPEKSAL